MKNQLVHHIVKILLSSVKENSKEWKEKDSPTEWHPDFVLRNVTPLRTVSSHRSPYALVAYNINLNTPSLEIAHDIAKKIRFIGGGLRYCEGHGRGTKDRGITQVALDLTDYGKNAYAGHSMVRLIALVALYHRQKS